MSHVPTFDTTTADPCRCLSQEPSRWGQQALLFLIGVSVCAGVAWLMAGTFATTTPVVPPTMPASGYWSASPSPTTVAPSPTVNPLIPPTYMTVFVTTPTPEPTATMTPQEQAYEAASATKTASQLPKPCDLTTVTPGQEGRVCYWPTPTPTPLPAPDYKTCETPVPGAFCRKEN